VAATLLATMMIVQLVNASHSPILLLAIGGLSGAAGVMAKAPVVIVAGTGANS